MPPDFSRDVRCILGLPFDVVTSAEAEKRLHRAIDTRTRCFLSTPNLNFVIGCMGDAAFRSSVLQSDLIVADGWPAIMVGRLLGARLPERVAGSSLFERLVESTNRPPIAVYFFGGPDGVAKAACDRLNAEPSGAKCTGFDAPGFGSVSQMSSRAHLERINGACPDFVVVALGAKKGQAWIQHNHSHIDAPVVSHLGAVVNFVAGTVLRAPKWVQTCGLEWLWRIKEEPSLWRRYASDGLSLIRLMVTRVIPLALHLRISAPDAQALAHASVQRTRTRDGSLIRMTGAWTRENSGPLRTAFAAHATSGGAVCIDMSRVTHLDATAIALLALLCGWQLKSTAAWEVANPSDAARIALRLSCADYLLAPLDLEAFEAPTREVAESVRIRE